MADEGAKLGESHTRAPTDAWDLPYPFEFIRLDPADDEEWESLQFQLGREKTGEIPPTTDRPLARCLEVVRENGAVVLVVETRYLDLDYRSEYSAFYSRAFDSYEDSTRRLHFFAHPFEKDEVWDLSKTAKDSYLGYIILRPQVKAVVGRTMLKPPNTLRNSVRTGVNENVTFFGQRLEVKAVPFMQQDARLGSCAHVALWMCHYSAFRHRSDRTVGRRPIAQFSSAVNPALGIGRILPSSGLTLHQISDILGQFGLPPLYYEVASLNDEDRPHGDGWLRQRNNNDAQVSRVCCRYLNSGLPVIAVIQHCRGGRDETVAFQDGPLHAVVVCGYRRVDNSVRLVANDDRRGPYLEFTSVTDDFDEPWKEHYLWEHVLAPLPEKLWLSGEAAERAGTEQLVEAARAAVEEGIGAAQMIVDLFTGGHLSFRTYAITGNRFKERIAETTQDPKVLRRYREARFPHFMWVVEAIDRRIRDETIAGTVREECVYGEIIYDATSDDRDPKVIATRLPGLIDIPAPIDYIEDSNTSTDLISPIRSSGQYGP